MSSQAQLALPGLAAEAAAEWVWSEETGEEIDVPAFVHETVMRAEVVSALAPSAGVYVDVTVGGAAASTTVTVDSFVHSVVGVSSNVSHSR